MRNYSISECARPFCMNRRSLRAVSLISHSSRLNNNKFTYLH